MADTNSNNTATKESPADDLAALKAKLQTAEQEREQFHDLAARTKADFENYQKRFQRDLAIERRFAHLSLASDLLAPLDNLERAMTAAQQAGEKGPLATGVGMVLSQFLDALRRHGITRLEAQGAAFDPNLHQAVMQQPSKDFKPFTVLQVLQPGYMIHDRVLRPASVIVSTAPATDEKKEGE
jgi:molecular chaperone GrpE